MRKIKKNLSFIDKVTLWEKSPYKFSNYKRVMGKAVFFPGCNFTSAYPKTTKFLIKYFKEKGIGTVMDCCQKPVIMLDIKKRATSEIRNIELRLKSLGVEEIIVVCPNCYKVFKDNTSLKVTSIYSKLAEILEGDKRDTIKSNLDWLNTLDEKKALYSLHIPCPDRAKKSILNDIYKLTDIENNTEIRNSTCCRKCKEAKLTKEGSESITTYCAACVTNLNRKGYTNVKHIMVEITGLNEKSVGFPLLNRIKAKFW